MSTTSRITLITGGSRGLGRNAALALAADGSDVIITYRSQADALTAHTQAPDQIDEYTVRCAILGDDGTLLV